MALSSGIFSTFLIPETATSSFTSLKPAKLRTMRTLTFTPSATASKPAAATTTSTTTREPRGIMKPRPVSPEMQAIVGMPEISRTQALKLIWAHIKANNLQDPENKKIIVCDEKLKKIFGGRDRVGFLEIGGLISPHFIKVMN